MKNASFIIALFITGTFLFSSCTKDQTIPDSSFNANINGNEWAADGVGVAADSAGNATIGADKCDGSSIFVGGPILVSTGTFPVSCTSPCVIQYYDAQGHAYSMQDGSVTINCISGGLIRGNFQGTAVNNQNNKDQMPIYGGFTACY